MDRRRDSESHPRPPPPSSHRFFFEAYDLVEAGGRISVLTNCGAFPPAYSGSELTAHGLLPSPERAYDVRRALLRDYPMWSTSGPTSGPSIEPSEATS